MVLYYAVIWMKRVFYHGIFCHNTNEIFDSIEICTIETMIKIIETGGLKSRRLQGKTSAYGFNGDDYISICSKENEQEYSKYPISAYYTYINKNFCFILDDDIDPIKIRYNEVNNCLDFEVISEIMYHFPTQRFSNMFDEWQVKDKIDLSHFIGIGIPFDNFYKDDGICEDCQRRLAQLISLADELGLDIVNTSDTREMENYKKKALSLERAKRKIYE